MAIEIIKVLSEVERELLAPHIEAERRFRRILEAWSPEPGAKFDIGALCFIRETPEPDKEGGGE